MLDHLNFKHAHLGGEEKHHILLIRHTGRSGLKHTVEAEIQHFIFKHLSIEVQTL